MNGAESFILNNCIGHVHNFDCNVMTMQAPKLWQIRASKNLFTRLGAEQLK